MGTSKKKMMIVSTRGIVIEPYSEGSGEQRQPPLPPILETTGGSISRGQPTCLIATIFEEVFRCDRVLFTTEEEAETPIEEAPIVEPSA